MAATQSNHQAAKYLQTSFVTYKKYAKLYIDQETGKTLFELHKNQAGKGVHRTKWGDEFRPAKLDMILTNSQYKTVKIHKLRNRLLYEGRLKTECYRCGHNEKRIIDYKQPLILNFKNGVKHDWRIENLEMICYNCHFLYLGNLYTEKQIEQLEDVTTPQYKNAEIDLKVDDYFLEHFKDLGLHQDEDYEDGEEFISFK